MCRIIRTSSIKVSIVFEFEVTECGQRVWCRRVLGKGKLGLYLTKFSQIVGSLFFPCGDPFIVRMVICSLLSIYSLFSSAMAANKERTFIMIKPDGVHRGLVGKIMERFEAKGFKLVALKFTWVS